MKDRFSDCPQVHIPIFQSIVLSIRHCQTLDLRTREAGYQGRVRAIAHRHQADADAPAIRNAKGDPAFAVVPWDEFERLRAGGDEDALLIAGGNAARGDETFPADVAKRMIASEPALKVLREWRALSQADLGARAGVPKNYISQIEHAERNMGRITAKKLAPVLGVSVVVLLD